MCLELSNNEYYLMNYLFELLVIVWELHRRGIHEEPIHLLLPADAPGETFFG